MTAQTAAYKVNLRKGDRFDFSLRYLANGSPVDLTGFDAEMVITWPLFRTTHQLPVPAGEINMTSDAGQITLGGAQGTILVHLDADETGVVPVGSPYVAWQLRIYSSAIDKETILSGPVNVLPNLFEAV